jgi:hypothetical protein
MKEHDFPDAGPRDLVVPPGDRTQVQIADGAASEAAELQVHQAFWVGHPDPFAGHGK